jgi:hypothetical protein
MFGIATISSLFESDARIISSGCSILWNEITNASSFCYTWVDFELPL